LGTELEHAMSAAATNKPARATEIGLVLQGGGALGAYEYGGIVALLDLLDEETSKGSDVTLKVVAGVSIGAINAACLVGARDRKDARKRLTGLWDDLVITTPLFVPPQIGRDLSLFGVQRFYTTRSDVMMWPTWTYIYNTHPLLRTLASRVDFAALNASPTGFVITAVDVESGELTRFANHAIGSVKGTTIAPEHVLASGSLPPQFPWTDIGDGANARHYWDGGVVDNTPLGNIIDAFSGGDVRRLVVIMNLFPTAAKLPGSLMQVNDRVDQLRFGNRLRQDRSTAEQFNELLGIIDAIAALVPGGLPTELAGKVDKYKRVETVEIALSADVAFDDQYGFRDFSRDGVEARRKAGRALTLAKLRPLFADGPDTSN
jgi:predicted acylesterase/phospholipase RssA